MAEKSIFQRIIDRGHGFLTALENTIEKCREGGSKKGFFRFEIMGQATLGKPGSFADVVHGDVGMAICGNGIQGGIEDLGLANGLKFRDGSHCW